MGLAGDDKDKPLLGIFKEQLVAELNPIIQVKFPYNINAGFMDTTLVDSGTVTQANSMAVISSGAAATSSALMKTHDEIVYQPGQGVLTRFTALFTTGVAGNTQEIGIGDDTDGFFIGYNGTEFGVLRRSNGTDNWIAQADFNGDFKNSNFSRIFDPTKGNIYQIQFQWLGFGVINFSVYDELTNSYDILHQVVYPNNYTEPSVYNPSFPLRVFSENTTNDTDITIKTASMAAFTEGKTTSSLLQEAVDNQKTITSEVNILTIRNDTTFQSKTNRSVVIPEILSVSSDGTKPVKFRLYKNTTLGGTPSYTAINANESVVSYDTAGTTVTGGTRLLEVFIGKEDGNAVNIKGLFKLIPGDTLTITAESASSSNASTAITWGELQ